MKEAKTIDEQIALMQSRHIEITNREKAEETLLDIGYYRLGFFSFPFEVTFPELGYKRDHNIKVGTKFTVMLRHGKRWSL